MADSSARVKKTKGSRKRTKREQKKSDVTDDKGIGESGVSDKVMKRMEERLQTLEEERKKEMHNMEEERRRLEEENRRLRSEIVVIRKGLKLEDERTREVERELKDVEKKVEEEASTHDNLENTSQEIESIKERLNEIQAALDEIVKWRDDASSKIGELEDVAKHAEHVPDMRVQLDEIGLDVSKKVEVERFLKIEKGIEDLFSDLDDLGEEMGYGESLNVAKVPPQVLEAAYQVILDDLTRELKKSYGSHETERIITKVTEDLRLRTSGSELFRVNGPNIELEDVVRSIEKGLISNKQVQMTYMELLKKLAEHVPHYKHKNLRAMLKVKSLEYAVDKLRILIAEHEYVKNELEKLMKGHKSLEPKDSKGSKYNVPDANMLAEDNTGGEESA
jgi:myosin heavy subunit